MGAFDVSYAGAFIGGLVSFLSPCVLPLVPPYLCFLGGITFDQLGEEGGPESAIGRQVLLSALSFVLGFTVVFVAFGATASWVGQLVADYFDYLAVVAGLVIIVLGLHFMGLFRIGFLLREVRYQGEARPAGLLGAFVIGLAFAFGWTPCVGPALAAILFVAGSEDQIAYGASLLAAYSLGIGIPFLLAAALVRPFLGFMRRARRYLGVVEKVMGGLLVVTGVLFMTGSMNEIGYWILEAFPNLATYG